MATFWKGLGRDEKSPLWRKVEVLWLVFFILDSKKPLG